MCLACVQHWERERRGEGEGGRKEKAEGGRGRGEETGRERKVGGQRNTSGVHRIISSKLKIIKMRKTPE